MTINYMGNDTYQVWLSGNRIVDMSSADIAELQEMEIPGSKIEELTDKIEELTEEIVELKEERAKYSLNLNILDCKNIDQKTELFTVFSEIEELLQEMQDKKVDDDLFFIEKMEQFESQKNLLQKLANG